MTGSDLRAHLVTMRISRGRFADALALEGFHTVDRYHRELDRDGARGGGTID